MTSIAEFVLPPADFPLGRVFEERPGVRFELDRVIPSGDTVMPYFWVLDSDMAGVLAVLRELVELRSIVLMEDLGDRGLFRAVWDPEYAGIMAAVAAVDVTVVSATGTSAGWTFELRAEATESFSEFQACCDAHGIDVSLARLHRLSEMAAGGTPDLTSQQREALLLAYEAGYYDESRRTDLETLASRLDITRPAFSARLRRGYRNLIENSLLGSDAEG